MFVPRRAVSKTTITYAELVAGRMVAGRMVTVPRNHKEWARASKMVYPVKIPANEYVHRQEHGA